MRLTSRGSRARETGRRSLHWAGGAVLGGTLLASAMATPALSDTRTEGLTCLGHSTGAMIAVLARMDLGFLADRFRAAPSRDDRVAPVFAAAYPQAIVERARPPAPANPGNPFAPASEEHTAPSPTAPSPTAPSANPFAADASPEPQPRFWEGVRDRALFRTIFDSLIQRFLTERPAVPVAEAIRRATALDHCDAARLAKLGERDFKDAAFALYNRGRRFTAAGLYGAADMVLSHLMRIYELRQPDIAALRRATHVQRALAAARIRQGRYAEAHPPLLFQATQFTQPALVAARDEALALLKELYSASGRYADAAALLDASVATHLETYQRYTELGMPPAGAAGALVRETLDFLELAQLRLLQGRLADARSELGRVFQIFAEANQINHATLARAHALRAAVALAASPLTPEAADEAEADLIRAVFAAYHEILDDDALAGVTEAVGRHVVASWERHDGRFPRRDLAMVDMQRLVLSRAPEIFDRAQLLALGAGQGLDAGMLFAQDNQREEANPVRTLADALLTWAARDLDAERFPKARQAAERARTLLRGLGAGNETRQAATAELLARIALASGQVADAHTHFAEARDIRIDLIRRGGAAALKNTGPFDRFLAALDALDLTPGETASQAASLMQWGQASQAAQALAQVAARFATETGADAALHRRHQDAVRRLREIESTLLLEQTRTTDVPAYGPEAEDRAREAQTLKRSLRAQQEALQGLEADLRQELGDRFAQANAILSPDPIPLPEIRDVLNSDEMLISYRVTGDSVMLLAATREDARFIRIKTAPGEVAAHAGAIRAAVDPSRWPDGTFLPAFPMTAAARLFDLLVAPALEALGSRETLIVVPDGALSALPFSLLLTEPAANGPPGGTPGQTPGLADYAIAPWLIRAHAVTVVPSIKALHALRKGVGATNSDLPFLGVGDPLLRDHPGGPATRGAIEPGGTTRGVLHHTAATPPPLARLFRGNLADVDAVRDLDSLPETADELAAMARILGADTASLRLREAATERIVRTTALDRYRVIAFATHGLLAGEIRGAAEPALVLTPPARASAEDDGLLTASEVANLELDADWVLLSACNTAGPAAGGGPGSAEGLSGLAQAFFYAGTRALFVSHWPVFSAPAVELTTTMLRAFREAPTLGRAGAHRRAMLALLEHSDIPEYAHPSVWAPFVVVGEGGTRGLGPNGPQK